MAFIVPFGAAQRLVNLLHQDRIAGKSGGEAHVKMRPRPVHELMAAEVAVAAKLNDCMWPCLMQIFNDQASTRPPFEDMSGALKST